MRGKNRNHTTKYQFIRMFLILFLFCGAMVIFSGRLVSLQIANHDYYTGLAKANSRVVKRIKTTRGEIYDRNGKPLVSNQITYDVTVNRSLLPYGAENEVYITLLSVLRGAGGVFADSLPLTKYAPFLLDESYIWDDKTSKALSKFTSDNKLTKADISGDKLYRFLLDKYGLSEETFRDAALLRSLIGFRYELEVNDFSALNPFTVIKDAEIGLVSAVSENLHALRGIEVIPSATRYYNEGSVAAHMLGRTGPIFPEEAEKYIEKGYHYNALVGKDGAEGAFEEYLRGIDGEAAVIYDNNGRVLSDQTQREPKAGMSVRLTIDLDMQRVAEEALRESIERTARNGRALGGGGRGEDARTGSVVVLDPNNFEVLTMASFPSFDMNMYQQNIAAMLRDQDRPLYNRSVFGIYAPGSTYKIATAAAALTKGVITEHSTVVCEGVYRKYSTYQPHCWIFDMKGITHGRVNITGAIQGSCNYFFYEIGGRLGIEALDGYSKELGLGVKTGIEIGESAGILAGPEYRETKGLPWQPGDTIQAAIGQSDNAFTPLQLTVFLSTIVNGGNRYRAHLLKSVDDFYTKEPAIAYEPVLENSAELSKEHLDILKRSMREVVEEGTAADIFANYPHKIGGKTGTAQTAKGNDAIFIGFAPYDKPQIVIAVVIENGYKGGNAAAVAREVFDYYFANSAGD